MHARRRWLAGLLSAAMALPIAASAQAKQGGQKEGAQKTDVKEDAKAEQLPAEPKKFAERLSMMNREEIEIAKLAQQKSSNPQVKEYAGMLVEHHGEQQQALTKLAKEKNWKLGEGAPLNPTDKKVVAANKADAEKLKVLEGKSFDAAFLSAMVGDHDRAVRMVEAAEKQYQDPEFRKSLGETKSALQEHWQQAYRLLGETRPTGS